ncbi:MAG: endo-1,3-alpha-glucanase family glycosylhydrolase [Kineosporiaceae bacterium]
MPSSPRHRRRAGVVTTVVLATLATTAPGLSADAGSAPLLAVTTACPAENLTSTPWLPFDMPDYATTGGSTKKVFANYFTPLSRVLSGSVNTEATDYYTKNYLNPQGENDKFLRGGGYLRDRPIPFTSTTSGYERRVEAAKTEVLQAIAAGLDGWYLDILNFASDSSPDLNVLDTTAAMLDAVYEVNLCRPNRPFKVTLMPDMGDGPTGSMAQRTPDNLADNLVTLVTGGGTRDRLSTLMTVKDGSLDRFVLMPARPESATVTVNGTPSTTEYWTRVLARIAASPVWATAGKPARPAALMPILWNRSTDWQKFKDISFGISEWGSRNGVNNAWDPASTFATEVATIRNTPGALTDPAQPGVKKKLIWAQPVSIQDHRPKDGRTDTSVRAAFREAAASLNLRNTWTRAMQSSAEWVQMPTWNDYSESSQFAPSARGGYGWLDLDSWYLTAFKRPSSGVLPTIQREGVYLVHRQQRMALDANGNQVVVPAVPEVPFRIPETNVVVQDVVDVVAFLKSTGDIRTRITGVDSLTAGVPAGVTVFTKPVSGTGIVAADVYHPAYVAGATPAFTTTSPYRVSDTPYVTDPTYLVASNLSGAHTDAAAVDQTPPSWGTGTGRWLLSGATAKLKWAAATDASASGTVSYAVYKPATAGEALTAANRKAVVRGQYWTDPAAGTNPLYKVVALDRMGNPSAPLSLAQTTVAADVADTSAPGLIRNLQASPAGVQPLGTPVTVTWASASDDDRVASYRIYRGSSSTFSSSATPLATVTAHTGVPVSLSYTDSAPLAGTSSYEVVAVDPTGNALSPSTTTLVKVSATRS